MAKSILKSRGVHTAKFLKYLSPFFNTLNERVKIAIKHCLLLCNYLQLNQSAITCSKLTIETLEQGMKFV